MFLKFPCIFILCTLLIGGRPGESTGMFLWGDGSYGRGALARSGNIGALSERAISKVFVAPLGQLFALTADGDLYSWAPLTGYNNVKNDVILGLNGTIATEPMRVAIPEFTSQIAACEDTVYVRTATGQLYGWGANNFGQLGYNTYDNLQYRYPRQIPWVFSSATWVSAVSHATLITRFDGSLRFLGNCLYLQCGASLASPYLVTSLLNVGSTVTTPTPIRKAALSGGAACAVDSNGEVYTWGTPGPNGLLGDGTTSPRTAPTKLASILGAMDVVGGEDMFAVIRVNGQVYVWGKNSYGSLGQPVSTASVATPTLLSLGAINAIQVSSSFDAFNVGSRLIVIGRNATSGSQVSMVSGVNWQNIYLLDQDLQNAFITTPSPITFANTPLVGESIISASSEGPVSAYVTGAGRLWYIIGNNAREVATIPVLGDANLNVRDRMVKITINDYNWGTGHMLDSAGNWWFFGDMVPPGFLGFNSAVGSGYPQFGSLLQVPTPLNVPVVDIASGRSHAIALTSAGNLLCLGTMPGGAFSNNYPTACFFNSANNIQHIASTSYFALVVLGNSSIYVWGSDGGSNVFNRPRLVNVPSSASRLQWRTVIGAGLKFTFYFVATTGEVYAYGLLGNSACEPSIASSYSSLVALPSLNGVVKLQAYSDVQALMSNGSFLMCNFDAYEIVDTSMIPDPIVDVAGGGGFYYALSAAGKLYGWGMDVYLGNGNDWDTTQRVSGLDLQIEYSSALGNRRITSIVANSYSTWVIAPLEIDTTSAWTTKEIPKGATYLTIRGWGFGSDSYDYALQTSPSRVVCSTLGINLGTMRDVIRCTLRAPLPLEAGSTLNVTATIPALFERTLPHIITVVSPPTLNSSTKSIPINARLLVLQGSSFGTNKDDMSVTLSAGACAVRSVSDNQIECEITGSLEPGPLTASVSRLGASTPFRPVGDVSGPATVTPQTFSIPQQAAYVRVLGRNFGSEIPDLVVTLTYSNSTMACTVTSITPPSGPDSEQSIVCIPAAPLTRGNLKAAVSRQGSLATDAPIMGNVNSRATISDAAANSKFALNSANITITGSGFYSMLADMSVTVRVTSQRKRATDIPCTPTSVEPNSIICTLSAPLTPGSLSAQVAMYGDVGAPFAPIGTAVPAPAVGGINSNYRVATNAASFQFLAYNVLMSEATVAVSPAGSCSNRTVEVTFNATTVTCFPAPLTVLQLGPLNVSISAFGGSSGFVQVATVIAAPSIDADPSKKYFVDDTSVSFKGSNFDDPNGVRVVLTVNTVFEKVCRVRPAESSATTIVCDLESNDSLNSTGSITAIVSAFGGRSESRSIGVVERREASGVLNTGQISGIGIGVAAFAIIIVILVILLVIRSRRRGMKGEQAPEVPEDMRGLFSIKATDITLLNKLGEGSYGAVYLGKYKGKFVAVKKLANAALATATNEFFREASLMMSINPHPNVIKLYGMCQEPSNFSLIMEFLSGGSLESLISDCVESDDRWPLADDLIWRLARGIAAGMASLAAQNIIHRDLAARNILLDTNMDPRVADFGFSRVVDSEEQQGKTNSTVGPIRWMAPESIRERVYSEKSDVWAYAMTVYEIVSGQEPFHGEDLLTVATKVRDTAATPTLPSTCPSWLATIITDCWSAEPSARPSFTEIVARLEEHRPKNFTESPLAPVSSDGGSKAPKRQTYEQMEPGSTGGYADADHLKTNKKSKSKQYE